MTAPIVAAYHRLVLTRAQAWTVLLAAVACDTGASLAVAGSHGLTRVVPAGLALLGFALANVLLAKVVQVVPTSIAYAVATGAGAVVVALGGRLLLGDELGAGTWAGIGLVVAGTVVLNRADARADR
ncbi:hypothetical protein GCM10011519_24950 [Marmoricola endophyticus]|uniref:Small multidrug resistance pump n=1 Tax=Marmoricola endophyticus TaxID=2040280 RepID=A0A917BM54_9ACTN|nr:SMR family transporter [Marmoricola endophyticus]GGF49952.1 hypothetical protein GCM10011519_24950 [Marmoricola endophyticus]